MDVVGLYHSIPHEERLDALKGVLEHWEDKTISTDTLLELPHVVLKNNFVEFKDDFYQQLRGTAIGTKCAPYHIISYHIISYHIISYHIISYHIISYHIISYQYHIISYHIISYIISYHQLFKHGSPFN